MKIRKRKIFVNCLVVGPFGLFVPYALAFMKWWLIMKSEKKKSWDG